jgi:hypothetical protein
MRRWYHMQFDGVMPSWFWRDRVHAKDVTLYSDVVAMEQTTPVLKSSASGWVHYDAKIRRRHIGRELESSQGALVDAIRLQLREHAEVGKSLAKRIDRMWPQTDKRLVERTVVSASMAIEMFASVYGNASPERRWLYRFLRNNYGMGGQWLAAVLSAAAISADMCAIIVAADKRGWYARGLKFYTDVTKVVHNVIRQSGVGYCPLLLDRVFSNYDVLMYHADLAGRFEFPEVNFESDITARANYGRPQVAANRFGFMTSEQFEADVAASLRAATAAFSTAVRTGREVTPAWVSANMHEIGTGGAAHYGEEWTIDDGGTVYRTRCSSKMAALNCLSEDDIAQWFVDHPPQCHGTGVGKVEPGKMRLLLPGPFAHWLAESIALVRGETAVYRSDREISVGLRPVQELASMTLRLRKVSEKLSLCSDYADFNILHTFERMRAQWLSMAEAVAPKRDSLGGIAAQQPGAFVAAACQWAAAALFDVSARAGQGFSSFTELVRGLWSGWRSTTFFNTIFNRAYKDALVAQFQRVHGYQPIHDVSVLGDDMASTAVSEFAGLSFLCDIDRSGLDAQAVKQLLDHRAEFLRLFYDDAGYIRGSLSRAVARLVSGDGQTAPRRSSPEMAYSVNETLHRLIRRGADSAKVERLRYRVVTYWARASVFRGGKTVRVAPPLWLLRTSLSAGGLGCGRFGEVLPGCRLTLRRPPPEKPPVGWFANAPHAGSRAAVVLGNTRMARYLRKGFDWVDHAAALMVGSLPAPLAAKLYRADNANLAAWYTCVGRNDPRPPQPLNADVGRAVNRVLRTVTGCCRRGVPLPHVADISAAADHVVHSALQTLSPIVGAVSKIGTRGSRLGIMLSKSGPEAHHARTTLVRHGRRVASALVNGDMKVSLPFSGAIGPGHLAIGTYAITAALDASVHTLRTCSDISRLTTNICQDVAAHVVRYVTRTPYWAKQMCY